MGQSAPDKKALKAEKRAAALRENLQKRKGKTKPAAGKGAKGEK